MALTLPAIRSVFAVIALGCAALIAVALYMEHGLGLAPCPLCITQRVFMILVGVIALVAFVHHPHGWGRRLYGAGVTLAAIAGGGFSTRQLWLQSLPEDQVPACGPSVDYIFQTFPFMEALELLLRGDGNCAEVVWTFLGLSIPAWTLIAFIGLALLGLWQALRPRHPADSHG